MKKNNIVKSLLLSALIVSTSFASEKNFIEMGMGFNYSKDNFTHQDSINDKNKNQTKGFANLAFAYNFELNENYTAYIKAEHGIFKLGSGYKMNNNKVDFGFLLNLAAKDEWQNPFVSNNSDKAELKERGFYIDYSFPLNQNIYSTIKYQMTNKEYKNDKLTAALKRDGIKHTLKLNNSYETYVVNFIYERYNADGKASSYQTYGLEAGKGFKMTDKLSVFTLLNLETIRYDETNPVLDEKIDATIYGAKLKFNYDTPFNYKNTYLSLLTGFEKMKANEHFYDKKNSFMMISLGYRF